MKIKKKNIVKILILIILIIFLIFLTFIILNKFQENKFKKMLKDNDAVNYKLTETTNGVETKVYVRDKILLSESEETITWVNELESKRIIVDEEYKTAILDQDDENLKVNSLNYTYINDFFDNSNQSFKYLGKEDGCYKIQFKEKDSKKITILYINEKLKCVTKMIQNAGNFELITEFKVEKNKVSKSDVELPNLEGYRAYDSVSSHTAE